MDEYTCRALDWLQSAVENNTAIEGDTRRSKIEGVFHAQKSGERGTLFLADLESIFSFDLFVDFLSLMFSRKDGIGPLTPGLLRMPRYRLRVPTPLLGSTFFQFNEEL